MSLIKGVGGSFVDIFPYRPCEVSHETGQRAGRGFHEGVYVSRRRLMCPETDFRRVENGSMSLNTFPFVVLTYRREFHMMTRGNSIFLELVGKIKVRMKV